MAEFLGEEVIGGFGGMPLGEEEGDEGLFNFAYCCGVGRCVGHDGCWYRVEVGIRRFGKS